VRKGFSSSLILFLSLVFASILLFLVDRSGWIREVRGGFERLLLPVEGAVYRTSQGLVTPLRLLRFARSGTARIADLERQVSELAVDAVRVWDLERENEAMRKLLGSPLPPQWIYVPAPIVGRGDELALGVGEVAGIAGGEAVVWQDMLFGTVATVSKRQSSVRLLTDPESRIPVFVPRSRVDGLVEGRFGSQVVLTQVLQSGDLIEDDLVVTSGESGIPRGLVVGKVGAVISDETDVYKELLVEPIVDIGLIDTVFVIKG